MLSNNNNNENIDEQLNQNTAEDTQNQPSAEDAIANLQTQLTSVNEKYLRALAEMENIKKRNEQAVINANKFALTDFAKALLPIMDIFNKALSSINIASADEATKPVLIGVEMTKQELEKVLAKFGITKIDALNQPFNSNLHEALSVVDNKDLPANTVAVVIEDGYMIQDRLLRASKVMITKNN